MIEIRPVRPDEFTRFRELRLGSLKESPHVFGSTLEVEAVMGFDDWKRWVADRPERRVLIAVDGNTWVGTATLSPYQGRPDTLGLFALWVAPAQRRTGVARRLVEELMSFAATTSRSRVRVHVALSNEAGLALFTSLAFTDTGERHRLREDLPVDAAVLERVLVRA